MLLSSQWQMFSCFPSDHGEWHHGKGCTQEMSSNIQRCQRLAPTSWQWEFKTSAAILPGWIFWPLTPDILWWFDEKLITLWKSNIVHSISAFFSFITHSHEYIQMTNNAVWNRVSLYMWHPLATCDAVVYPCLCTTFNHLYMRGNRVVYPFIHTTPITPTIMAPHDYTTALCVLFTWRGIFYTIVILVSLISTVLQKYCSATNFNQSVLYYSVLLQYSRLIWYHSTISVTDQYWSTTNHVAQYCNDIILSLLQYNQSCSSFLQPTSLPLSLSDNPLHPTVCAESLPPSTVTPLTCVWRWPPTTCKSSQQHLYIICTLVVNSDQFHYRNESIRQFKH